MASFTENTLEGLNSIQDFVNDNIPGTELQSSHFGNDGFRLPSSYSPDGNGLPYTKVPQEKAAQFKRNIITWFVPEFGLVRMYINPQNISYDHKKLITKDRTKGGYTLQYWGEDLTTISINGTTGSSGIEGINMLYELYRAEQLANDGLALSLAASNAANDLAAQGADFLGGAVGNVFGATPVGGLVGSVTGGAVSGLLGSVGGAAAGAALASKDMNTMAQIAFTVEMFYNGWVYRGYFQDMSVQERADNFLLDYRMTFMATQRRGYRVNYFPWTRSATDGPSQYNTDLALKLNDKDIG